jgi:hypothetical protein
MYYGSAHQTRHTPKGKEKKRKEKSYFEGGMYIAHSG